jgi:Protein of unknown function (DUF2695)
MSKDAHKDGLKKAWREQQRQKLLASIPMPHQALRDLFDHLDGESAVECDHTLRATTAFLQQRELDVERIVPWLQEHGGHCDCEVLANVGDEFAEILAR